MDLSSTFCCEVHGCAPPSLLGTLLQWLEVYGKGKEPDIPIDFGRKGQTPFQQAALQRMQKIPFGRLLTYKELAAEAGNARAARAIGNICRDNPFPLFIPCHRIVKTGGSLGGFAFGQEMKKALLQFEGSLIE